MNILGSDYQKIIVETEEDEPKIIAVIDDKDIDSSEGFRVRLIPR